MKELIGKVHKLLVLLLELSRFEITLGELEITFSGWPFVYAIPSQMIYLVASITLNNARSYVMQVFIVAVVAVVLVVVATTIRVVVVVESSSIVKLLFVITRYLHWSEVIKFGDSYEAPLEESGTGSASESSTKKKGKTVAITTEDMQKRRNDVKARTTLLLALPDEHQLRFSKYKTVQELAEKIARVTNPLALVAQQQPVYHPQNHPTHYTQNSSTRSQQAATKNREKAIVNSPQSIYDQEPSMVDEDD
nr:hypothetical protein [Tanacetum cinerariifolium]